MAFSFNATYRGGASARQVGQATTALMQGAFQQQMAELRAKMLGNQQNVEIFSNSIQSGASRQNQIRQTRSINRQARRALSAQIASSAARGVSSTSRSSLATLSDTIADASARAIDMEIAAENQRRFANFQTQSRITQLRNQAILTRHEGNFQAALGAQRANTILSS